MRIYSIAVLFQLPDRTHLSLGTWVYKCSNEWEAMLFIEEKYKEKYGNSVKIHHTLFEDVTDNVLRWSDEIRSKK